MFLSIGDYVVPLVFMGIGLFVGFLVGFLLGLVRE